MRKTLLANFDLGLCVCEGSRAMLFEHVPRRTAAVRSLSWSDGRKGYLLAVTGDVSTRQCRKVHLENARLRAPAALLQALSWRHHCFKLLLKGVK